MMASGTTIVRVHDDIAARLKLNHDGIKTSSGGTLGQCS